ncbi:MAG: cytochrome c [Pseudomonadota bacterium]
MTLFAPRTPAARLGTVLTLAAAVFVAPSALASGDAAVERQKLMSNVGAATGAGAAMVKGQVEFNAVQAQLVMRTLNSSARGFGFMFPAGSETGAKTEASPKIWEDSAGFAAAVDKFIVDTSAVPTDLDSFKAAFGAATANCGTCHRAYRVKKD